MASIDTYSKVGFAKLHTGKTAITAADMLNDRVLPFFESHDVPMQRILTDRGTEYCGRLDEHPNQLYQVAFRRKRYRSIEEIRATWTTG